MECIQIDFKRLRLDNPLIAAPLALAIGIGGMVLLGTLVSLFVGAPYSTSREVGTPLTQVPISQR